MTTLRTALERLHTVCAAMDCEIEGDRPSEAEYQKAMADAERLLKAEDTELAGMWRPIETAPQDMTERVVVRWVDSDGQECTDLDYKEDGCWMHWHDSAEHVEMIGGHGVSYTPPYEHWMPLPPPPAALKGQQ